MASAKFSPCFLYFLFSFVFCLLLIDPCLCTTRKLTSLVQQQPLVLKYHNGPLLKGNITVNLLWYGNFSSVQRSIIVDFLRSLSSAKSQSPSVNSWWRRTEKFRSGGSNTVLVGSQVMDENHSLGKLLTSPQLQMLAAKARRNNGLINVVLTSGDVGVEGFCMSRCGTHGSTHAARFTYAWVGNPVSQCPGQCAWPFHEPMYGPQTAPLVPPNGDVGVDGMIINLATLLAGAVTNPFGDGYFQGSPYAPLEAVSACTGIFGSGAYPGYSGRVLVDKVSGASYNAIGINGRKFLLPAMWDPQTSKCKTIV